MALSAAVRKKLFGLTVKIHTHLFLFIRLGPFFFVLFFSTHVLRLMMTNTAALCVVCINVHTLRFLAPSLLRDFRVRHPRAEKVGRRHRGL